MSNDGFHNPFRPSAGHPPPFLAGREGEREEFRRLLTQPTVFENMVLTGLRGVGKTVLLDSLKPDALTAGWVWTGSDLSEAASLTEERLATRLLTDLAMVTTNIVLDSRKSQSVGFGASSSRVEVSLDYEFLREMYDRTPGLTDDKLKTVIAFALESIAERGESRGVVFAYDEAQNLADHAAKDEFPLSLVLDVFSSLQRKGLPLLLVLAGLPTLYPRLIEARTSSERMFRAYSLESLDPEASRQAVKLPIEEAGCPVTLSDNAVDAIVEMSAGYPYFIQFICREVYDALVRGARDERVVIPFSEIHKKLDDDFFAGRWARATDRQRDLLKVVAQLESAGGEFTVQQVVERSREGEMKPFTPSHVSQVLGNLAQDQFVFRNRHGHWSLAVPLLDRFVLRQIEGEAGAATSA